MVCHGPMTKQITSSNHIIWTLKVISHIKCRWLTTERTTPTTPRMETPLKKNIDRKDYTLHPLEVSNQVN